MSLYCIHERHGPLHCEVLQAVLFVEEAVHVLLKGGVLVALSIILVVLLELSFHDLRHQLQSLSQSEVLEIFERL